jgi:hypothetical protein
LQAYCTSCGAASLEHANYCWSCGRSLNGEQSLSIAWRTEYKEVYLDWSEDPVRMPATRNARQHRELENLILEGIKPLLADGWDRDTGPNRGVTYDEQFHDRWFGRGYSMVRGCWVMLRRVVR